MQVINVQESSSALGVVGDVFNTFFTVVKSVLTSANNLSSALESTTRTVKAGAEFMEASMELEMDKKRTELAERSKSLRIT